LEIRFSASFSGRLVDKVLEDFFPKSTVLKETGEKIDEMEELWKRVPNLEGLGYYHDDELSRDLQEKFGLSDGDVEGKYWSQIAIKCYGLDGLSFANGGTSFSDVDANYKLIQKLKESWIELLLNLPGFPEQLSSVVIAWRDYNQSYEARGFDASEQEFEAYHEALRDLQTFSDEVDKKLIDVKESGLISSDDLQYFDLLTQLGIDFQEIEPEPELESEHTASSATTSPAATAAPALALALDQQKACLQQQISDLQQQLAELLAQKKP
jgi:hypothetical protein